MGRYSYSQPSSSKDYDIETWLLEEEVALYVAEGESVDDEDPVQYHSQPEADDGIPKTCYCGGEPVVATAYTSKDPGRRYFTCESVDDGDCHIWKWWDVAVMEEMSEFQRQLRELKNHGNETEHKLVNLEKTVGELAKKRSWVSNGFPLVVCAMVGVLVLKWFLEEIQSLKMGVSDL